MRTRRAGLLVLVLATVLVGISPAFGPGSAAGGEPARLRTIPETDVNPYGANFFLQFEAEPWKVDKTLQMARDGGLGWVKQHFPWEDIELRKGRFWDDRLNKSTWEKYDLIVDTARRHGLQVIARLDRPPPWARKDNSVAEAPPDNFEDYGDFVAAVVEHYKGRIFYYQLWNEPNIYPEWGNRPVDPIGYVRLLRLGYQRAKAIDPNVRILAAPLAQTLEQSEQNLSELEYLDAMYRAGAKGSFDVQFANAYGFDRPPEEAASPTELNFQRVRLLHDVMARHGDGGTPVWLNEFGWNAAPADFPPDRLIWRRVTEAQQAEWVVRAVEKARAEWDWAGVFCVWFFRQSGQIPPDRADYYFRMVDVGFTPRPLYNAIKKATEPLSVVGLGSYQESNPAVSYLGEWTPELRADASGRAARVARAAGDSATIAFRGTEVYLVTAKGPEAPTVYVTLDGGEANRLPRDRQGRSYVDLYSASRESNVVVPIAQALPSGAHVLRATIGPTHAGSSATAFVLDGFVVQDDLPPNALALVRTVGVPVALVGIGGIVLLLLVRRHRRGAQQPPTAA